MLHATCADSSQQSNSVAFYFDDFFPLELFGVALTNYSMSANFSRKPPFYVALLAAETVDILTGRVINVGAKLCSVGTNSASH